MRRAVWAPLLTFFVGALAFGLLLFPTEETCRASGRVVDPTGRHCVAADGYVQLREHVLFHTSQVVAIAAIVLVPGWIGYRAVRRRRRPAR